MEIQTERQEDGPEIEALLDTCFSPGRMALSSYRLREGVPPARDLCVVARGRAGEVAGSVRFWPVRIVAGRVGVAPAGAQGGVAQAGIAQAGAQGGARERVRLTVAQAGVAREGVPAGLAQEAMLLGPVAVHPTRQGEGLGAFLIQSGLERAAAAGVARILLVGDAPYYSRFGFARLDGVIMPPPTNPDRVLGIWGWDGVVGTVMRIGT